MCRGILAGAMFFLIGCQVTERQPVQPVQPVKLNVMNLVAHESFQLQPVEDDQELFELSDKQKQEFLNFYNQTMLADVRKDKRLQLYLEDKLAFFDYYGETFSASQSLEENKGDCVSLAILTQALAQLVDLPLNYQEVTSAPVYFKEDNLVFVSEHVRTRIDDPDFIPQENTFYVFKPGTIIDYFPNRSDYVGQSISRQEFTAKFYLNKAANHLADKNWDRVYSYISKAESLSPGLPETANMWGVLHRRIGLLEQAREIYQTVVDYGLANINLLKNYRTVLEDLNDEVQLNKLQSIIDDMDDPNPYNWIEMADEALSKQEYTLAQRYLDRALKHAPYLHQAYFGKAKLAYLKGHRIKAKELMEEALSHTHDQNTLALYQLKYQGLQQR